MAYHRTIQQVIREATETVVYDGIFCPTEYAQLVLGQSWLTFDIGTMFTYLFRRFGYPMSEWDSHQNLVEYTLSTPLEGVCLTIAPPLFGYVIAADVATQCREERVAPLQKWTKSLQAWAQQSKGIVALGEVELTTRRDDNPENYARVLEAWEAWLRIIPDANSASADGLRARFVLHKTKEWQQLSRKFQRFQPRPSALNEDVEFAEGSLCWQVYVALTDTIRELLRPVDLQGWRINILGVVEDSPHLKMGRRRSVHLPALKLATPATTGVGLGQLGGIYRNERDVKRWREVMNAVAHDKGDGDWVTAIRRWHRELKTKRSLSPPHESE